MNRVYIGRERSLPNLLGLFLSASCLRCASSSLGSRDLTEGSCACLPSDNNDSTDMGYLLEILNKGVWMGLDRTTNGPILSKDSPVRQRDNYNPNWQDRAETIKFLIDAGFGHRILVGHDTMVANLMAGEGPPPAGSQLDNYSFLIEVVLPYVVELGATQEQIDKIVYVSAAFPCASFHAFKKRLRRTTPAASLRTSPSGRWQLARG